MNLRMKQCLKMTSRCRKAPLHQATEVRGYNLYLLPGCLCKKTDQTASYEDSIDLFDVH